MSRFLCAMAVLLILGSLALADCRKRVVANRVVVKEKVTVATVVTPAIAAIAVAVPVLVPTYTAAYVPSAAPSTHVPARLAETDSLQQILKRLDAIETRGGRMAAPLGNPTTPSVMPPAASNEKELVSPATQTPSESPLPKALAVLDTRCAQCHTGAAAKGRFQIFSAKGSLAPGVDFAKVFKRVYRGEMPLGSDNKPTPLSDEEVSSLVDLLGGQP